MNILIIGLSTSLADYGFKPSRLILFGSYPKGKATDKSDIDIAVWSDNFTGNRVADIEKLTPVISQFKNVELHPFSLDDNSISNPFVLEIEKTGIDYSHLLG